MRTSPSVSRRYFQLLWGSFRKNASLKALGNENVNPLGSEFERMSIFPDLISKPCKLLMYLWKAAEEGVEAGNFVEVWTPNRCNKTQPDTMNLDVSDCLFAWSCRTLCWRTSKRRSIKAMTWLKCRAFVILFHFPRSSQNTFSSWTQRLPSHRSCL